MHIVLLVAAIGTALGAAVLSTWSPCGRSMLSTLTPLGARSRAASYRSTVAWFVVGAVAGGACLGGVMAGAAAVAGGGRLSPGVVGVVGVVATATAAVADRVLGPARIPGHHRQVNERWLDRYRPWVYGAGFGWQIGTGFATYVTTTTLYLLVVLGALTGSPMVALGLGTGFGLVRGLAVLLGRRLGGPEALVAFHRRFDRLEPVARHWVVGGTMAMAMVLVVAVVSERTAPAAVEATAAGIVATALFVVGLYRRFMTWLAIRRVIGRGAKRGEAAVTLLTSPGTHTA